VFPPLSSVAKQASQSAHSTIMKALAVMLLSALLVAVIS
jgi:hypothetical protein